MTNKFDMDNENDMKINMLKKNSTILYLIMLLLLLTICGT